MQIGYMYTKSGEPFMERQYTAPGKWYWGQAEVRLEKERQPEELVSIHMGHGHFKSFKCIASDNKHALLQACS